MSQATFRSPAPAGRPLHVRICHAVAFLLFATLVAAQSQTARPGQESAADYQLHPSLEMGLFAREPDIVDPVALTFDEAGRVYVVEMRDYPYGIGPNQRPGGTVRLLEDRDGDGRADRSILFAEQLSFPTSIAPWQGGVFVAAPPEILYLKDTDGDGKADVRTVAFRGFTLGVTDSNMNGLRWGLDNRIHGSNGGNGGVVTSPRQPGLSVSLGNLDFSFDPQSGDFAVTSQTSAGFGLVFDDWGRSFCTYNINHIQHRAIAAHYLERFPGFPPVSVTASISDHAEMARIFPISVPETRVNHPEQSGHFSSAGGMGYIGQGFPVEALRNSIFIGDVVGNLVHRDRISPNGPGFAASRAPEETAGEFFASRDPAFRPVGIELGLDGALYLIDMQRDVIEHPDYIPDKVKQKMNIRAGEERGRIYRIVPRGKPFKPASSMEKMSSIELARELSHWNQIRRSTAQRLILERGDRSVIPVLIEMMVREKEALGRLHAMWTLQALKAIEPGSLLVTLSDIEPGVRENALIVAEQHARDSLPLQERMLALAGDADARVRFQSALSIGAFDNARSHSALLRILERDWLFQQSRWAVMSSLRNARQVIGAIQHIVRTDRFRTMGLPEQALCVQELADLAIARAGSDLSGELLELLAAISHADYPAAYRAPALSGIDSGLSRVAKPMIDRERALQALAAFFDTGQANVATAAWKVSRRLGLAETDRQRQLLAAAIKHALDDALPLPERLQNIRLLELGDFASVGTTLFSLLDLLQPAPVQQTGIEILSRFESIEVAKRLVAQWRNLSPATRPKAIELFLQRIPFHPILIEAIESDAIKLGELNLDLEQRRRLLRDSTPEIRARAAKLIGDEEYSNRKQVVESWLGKLPLTGDASRGRALFETHCAQCHVMDGLGHAVGPNLAALAHRSVEDLASNILDPNMAIQPTYISYNVELADGELQNGILQAQSKEAVTLLQPLGKQVVLPRAQIKRMQSSGLSLMPEGLETTISPQDLRDLIAFLQKAPN